MNPPHDIEIIHALIEKFCDNININVPDTREEIEPIIDRMFNIGLITPYEKEAYINYVTRTTMRS